MSFEKGLFDGFETYTLKNKNGMEVTILSIGASVISALVPDRDGKKRDVVLGYGSAKGYLNTDAYFGAVCGRFAFRIADASVEISGKEYKLTCNEGNYTIHGGSENPCAMTEFDYKSNTDNSVTLTRFLPDGENGFPGNMTIDVTYTLSDENGIRISYFATSDKDTVINLSNHTYFNLDGHASGSVEGHIMTMNADTFAPIDENIMFYGKVVPVTPVFDFRKPKEIGRDINSGDHQLELAGGYDHAWTVRTNGKTPVACTEVYCPESGINLTVKTNSPIVHLYTGNYLPGNNTAGKDGTVYVKRGGFCLETGFYSNCVKFPELGMGFLKKDEVFDYETEFKFDVK